MDNYLYHADSILPVLSTVKARRVNRTLWQRLLKVLVVSVLRNFSLCKFFSYDKGMCALNTYANVNSKLF